MLKLKLIWMLTLIGKSHEHNAYYYQNLSCNTRNPTLQHGLGDEHVSFLHPCLAFGISTDMS
jgi:hypothetical protein